MEDFLKASKDDSMREIALANYFGCFETVKRLAVKTAQTYFERTGFGICGPTAFHWGIGDLDKAEDEWQTLCTSGRGFGQSESAESVRSLATSRIENFWNNR